MKYKTITRQEAIDAMGRGEDVRMSLLKASLTGERNLSLDEIEFTIAVAEPDPPMRKTVYPWHAVKPEYAQWAAVDENGSACFYSKEPFIRVCHWAIGGKYTFADTLVGYVRGDEPWQESKQKRPEGV